MLPAIWSGISKEGLMSRGCHSGFDICTLPIRCSVADQTVDMAALVAAMEQLLMAVEPDAESDSISHPDKFNDPIRQHRNPTRVPRKPRPRSTGGEHTVG